MPHEPGSIGDDRTRHRVAGVGANQGTFSRFPVLVGSMPIARDGAGAPAAIRALSSQVKPTFMVPALASSVYGGLLAGVVSPLPAAIHVFATFLALYAAHAKDSYVDFYERGEDETLPLTRSGCRVAIAGSIVAFAACLGALWWLAGPVAALLAFPLAVLGYLHAPWLDRHPVGTSLDYAAGVSLVVLGGFTAQAGPPTPTALGVAAVFVPVLAAGGILIDVEDVESDRRIGKRTVPVLVGPRRTRTVAAWLVGIAAGLVVALVAVGPLPTAGRAAAPVLALAGLGVVRVEPRRGLHLLMAGMALVATLLLLSVRGVPPW